MSVKGRAPLLARRTTKPVVTIDGEGDSGRDHGAPFTARDVAFWQPVMDLLNRHGVRPTHLVTTQFVEDPAAGVLLLRRSGDQRAQLATLTEHCAAKWACGPPAPAVVGSGATLSGPLFVENSVALTTLTEAVGDVMAPALLVPHL